MPADRRRILFLCTGNAARSQMAEALARLDYGDVLDPVSAGSRPAGFVHPLAIHAIEELGSGMEKARSKSAEEFLEEKFDLVVTVCDSAAADCPTWPNARHLVHWSIEDPSFIRGTEEERAEAFRATRDELRRRIDSLMEALRRSHPKRADVDLLTEGVGSPRGRPVGPRFQAAGGPGGKGRGPASAARHASRGGAGRSSCASAAE